MTRKAFEIWGSFVERYIETENYWRE